MRRLLRVGVSCLLIHFRAARPAGLEDSLERSADAVVVQLCIHLGHTRAADALIGGGAAGLNAVRWATPRSTRTDRRVIQGANFCRRPDLISRAHADNLGDRIHDAGGLDGTVIAQILNEIYCLLGSSIAICSTPNDKDVNSWSRFRNEVAQIFTPVASGLPRHQFMNPRRLSKWN